LPSNIRQSEIHNIGGIKMKVVGFIGSPRKSGNTAALVGEVLRGARDNGAETIAYNINQLNIRGCQACYKCQTPDGKCVQKDDMAKLYDEINSADAIVIGTPVYMAQVTSQTKTLIDRFFAFLYPAPETAGNFKTKLGKKKTVTVYAQGQPDPSIFADCFNLTEGILSFIGFDIKKRITAPGARNQTDAKENAGLMKNAYAAGVELTK
jgi:multimeric flavodoxin WrbA